MMNAVQINGDGNPPHTPAKQWRQAQGVGYTVQLPSENWVTMRSVALDQLLESGRIPDFLTPLASRQLWTEESSEEIAKSEDLHRDYMDLINLIIPLAVIAPAIVENPDPEKEEISLKDVEFSDKIVIFNLAISPAVVLKSFRNQQAASVFSSRPGEDVRTEAELSSGN